MKQFFRAAVFWIFLGVSCTSYVCGSSGDAAAHFMAIDEAINPLIDAVESYNREHILVPYKMFHPLNIMDKKLWGRIATSQDIARHCKSYNSVMNQQKGTKIGSSYYLDKDCFVVSGTDISDLQRWQTLDSMIDQLHDQLQEMGIKREYVGWGLLKLLNSELEMCVRSGQLDLAQNVKASIAVLLNNSSGVDVGSYAETSNNVYADVALNCCCSSPLFVVDRVQQEPANGLFQTITGVSLTLKSYANEFTNTWLRTSSHFIVNKALEAWNQQSSSSSSYVEEVVEGVWNNKSSSSVGNLVQQINLTQDFCNRLQPVRETAVIDGSEKYYNSCLILSLCVDCAPFFINDAGNWSTKTSIRRAIWDAWRHNSLLATAIREKLDKSCDNGFLPINPGSAKMLTDDILPILESTLLVNAYAIHEGGSLSVADRIGNCSKLNPIAPVIFYSQNGSGSNKHFYRRDYHGKDSNSDWFSATGNYPVYNYQYWTTHFPHTAQATSNPGSLWDWIQETLGKLKKLSEKNSSVKYQKNRHTEQASYTLCTADGQTTTFSDVAELIVCLEKMNKSQRKNSTIFAPSNDTVSAEKFWRLYRGS